MPISMSDSPTKPPSPPTRQIEQTTPEEFLTWVSPWAMEKAAQIINSTGEFGSPILFALADDGTHHVSALVFWSMSQPEETMDGLRKVIQANRMQAVALLTKGRMSSEGSSAQEVMVLLKSIRDQQIDAELYVPESSEDGTISFDSPIEIRRDVEGWLAEMWQPIGE